MLSNILLIWPGSFGGISLHPADHQADSVDEIFGGQHIMQPTFATFLIAFAKITNSELVNED